MARWWGPVQHSHVVLSQKEPVVLGDWICYFLLVPSGVLASERMPSGFGTIFLSLRLRGS